MSQVVSAIPSELLNWSGWAGQSDARLEAAGRDVTSALEAMMSTFSFSLVLTSPTPAGDDLMAYAVRNSVTDSWVGQVGQAFATAGRAGFIGPLSPSEVRAGLNRTITVSEEQLAGLVGADPVALGARLAAAARLAGTALDSTGVDPATLRELQLHAGDLSYLQAFFQAMGAASGRSLAYVRGLNLSVPQQVELVQITPLLAFLRAHPNAARAGGLGGLDAALFQPGGLLYNGAGGAWSPYKDLRPGSQAAWDQAMGFPGICTAGGATYFYQGGGFIIGPDGREYPLVDPSVNQGGRTFLGDAPFSSGNIDTLDGADPGWQTLYSRDGVDSFGPAPSGWDRFWAFWAGTAGVDPAPNVNALQAFVNVTPGGYPALGEGPSIPATPAAPPTLNEQDLKWMPVGNGQWAWVDMATYQPSRDILRQYPTLFKPPAPGSPVAQEQQASERGQAAVDGVTGLGPITLEGIADAATLGNPNLRYYSVVFQQNSDGRIRAILRTYRVAAGQDSNGQSFYRILPYATSMGPGGTLQDRPMTFREPTKPVPPSMGPVMPPVIVGG